MQPPQSFPSATPSAGNPAQRYVAWVQRNKVLGGCATLILACVLLSICGGIVSALGGGSGGGATSTAQTGQSSQQQQATSTPKATNTPAPPTATPKPKQWVTASGGHFAGNGNTQTQTFALHDGMRIVWTYTPSDDQANLFEIELFQQGQNDFPADLPANDANKAGPQSGEYNVHADGNYYLKVSALEISGWTIDVQQFQ